MLKEHAYVAVSKYWDAFISTLLDIRNVCLHYTLPWSLGVLETSTQLFIRTDRLYFRLKHIQLIVNKK